MFGGVCFGSFVSPKEPFSFSAFKKNISTVSSPKIDESPGEWKVKVSAMDWDESQG